MLNTLLSVIGLILGNKELDTKSLKICGKSCDIPKQKKVRWVVWGAASFKSFTTHQTIEIPSKHEKRHNDNLRNFLTEFPVKSLKDTPP